MPDDTGQAERFLDLSHASVAPKVAICIASGGSSCDETTRAIFSMKVFSFNTMNVQFAEFFSEGSNIAENQNQWLPMAERTGVDWLLIVETDMMFPKEALVRLLSHNKPIVGAAYMFKDPLILEDYAGKTRLMGFELGGEPITWQSLYEGDALRKVAGLPMGLLLIHIDALKAVRKRIADMHGMTEEQSIAFYHPLTITPERVMASVGTTDLAFCGRAREAGYEVWLDADLSRDVTHIGKCYYRIPPRELLGGAAND